VGVERADGTEGGGRGCFWDEGGRKEWRRGGRKNGEKEVLSLRSMISTCPRLDVNANTNRKLFKVAPFVHNALAVCYSLFLRQAQTKNEREREREDRESERSAGRGLHRLRSAMIKLKHPRQMGCN